MGERDAGDPQEKQAIVEPLTAAESLPTLHTATHLAFSAIYVVSVLFFVDLERRCSDVGPMTGIRTFIIERRREIQAQIDALKAELLELDAAEDAVKARANSEVQHIGGTVVATPTSSKMTIKEMILEVLGVLPAGADANKIIRVIRDRFGKDIPRTSLSPQLSRLRQEGHLDLDGSIWRISNRQDLFDEKAKAPERLGQSDAFYVSDGLAGPSEEGGSKQSEP